MTTKEARSLRKGDIVSHSGNPSGIYRVTREGVTQHSNGYGGAVNISMLRDGAWHGDWAGYVAWLTLIRRGYPEHVSVPEGL